MNNISAHCRLNALLFLLLIPQIIHAAPVNLVANKGSNINGGIRLSWQETATRLSTYRIFRSEGLNGAMVQIGTSSTTQFVDSTSQRGIVYGYRVRNSAGINSNFDYGYDTKPQSSITGTGKYKKVSAGNDYSLALKIDGRLFATGQNSDGQLGDGTITPSTSFKQVLTGVADMLAGSTESFALKTDGTLWATGSGYSRSWQQILSGVSSIHSNDSKTVYWAIVSGTAYTGTKASDWAATSYTDIKQISTGYAGSTKVTYTLKNDGRLFQDTTNILTGVKKIYSIIDRTCATSCTNKNLLFAIKNDNTLWAYRGGSTLPDGLNGLKTTAWRLVFDNVKDVSATEGDASINNVVLVTKNDGTLWATGYGASLGQYGDGSSGLTGYWKQVFDGVASSSVGLYHSLALRTNGTIWVTGENSKGQHGLNDFNNRNLWTQTGLNPPSKVQNVQATDGTIYDEVQITWTSDPDATHYDIYASTTLNEKRQLVGQNITTTRFNHSLTNTTQHFFYTVVAKNGGDNTPVLMGPDSDPDEGYTKIFQKITGFSVSQGTQTNKVVLNWNQFPEQCAYNIFRSTNANGDNPQLIATLPTSDKTSYQDISNTNGQSYFYAIQPKINTSSGPFTDYLEGWANVAPTSATVTLTTDSTKVSEPTSPVITDPNITAGKVDTFTLSITEQPTVGSLTIVEGKFVYTPPVDGKFSGELNFKFSATDKGASTIAGTGKITVLCATPTISGLSLPVSNVLQATPFQANATYSMPACSTNGQVKLDVLDGNSNVVIAGASQPTSNGKDQSRPFSSQGVTSVGNHIIQLTASNQSGSTTKTAILTVTRINLPILTILPGQDIIIKETTLEAKLSNPPSVNCQFTRDIDAATSNPSLCYLTLSSTAPGLVDVNITDLPSMTGVIDEVGNYPVKAEVFKHDGTKIVKVGQVIKNFSVSCSVPLVDRIDIPELLPNEIPTYNLTYKAYSCNEPLNGSLVIKRGPVTVDTLQLSNLGYGASAIHSANGIGLAVGNYTAELSITGSNGTSVKSQSFTVEAVDMPTLDVSHQTLPQGEARLDAKLITSPTANCQLTSSQSDAEHDPKKCYVALSTTIQDMTAGIDEKNLPTLTGYPYTVGEYTVQATISRWVNSVRYDEPPIIKNVTITPVVPSTFNFTGKNSVYIGIEQFSLNFKQATGQVCNLYPDEFTAKIEASKEKRACFANLTTDPALTKTLTMNQYKIDGQLNVVGTNSIGYSVKRFFPNGRSMILQSGEFNITVNELPPPQVILKGGQLITAGKYYVPLNKAIARATITSGFSTKAKMKVTLTDKKQSVIRENILNGGSYWLSTPELGFLEERPVTLRVAWQDYPDIYNEQTITAVGGAESGLKLAIDTQPKTPDTEQVTVKVKIGRYSRTGINYTQNTMGQWRVKILAETNNESNPTQITDLLEMTNGVATFQINPSGNTFMKLTAVAELISNIDGLDSTLTSSTRYIEVVKGSPISGKITANTLESPWPKNFNLKLDLTADNRSALKSATWEESEDGGATWINKNPNNTTNYIVSMDSPSKILVRVKMINKNTQLESYTPAVEVFSYAKLDAKIIGPRHASPDKTITLSSQLRQDGAPTTDTVNEWVIEKAGGKLRLSGQSVSFAQATEGKIYVTLRSRPSNTSSTDQKSWTTTRSYVMVSAPVKPTVYAQGPRDVETGRSYHYVGTTKPSWGSIESVNKLASEWLLPDGKTVSGQTLDWVPTEQDLITKKPLVFRSWVDGYKDTTTRETAVKYEPWTYVWPNWTMKFKQLSIQAPSDLILSVTHDAPKMNKRFEGLTYEWSYPNGVNGRDSHLFPDKASAQVLYSGEYDISLTIKDKRGHSTELTQHVVAQQAMPYKSTLKVGKSNSLDRIPMTITVRPTNTGGHPLDSIISQAWSVDGIPVEDFSNRSIMIKNISDAGDHMISYIMTSKMGMTSKAEIPLHLVSNKLPTCTLSSKPTSYVSYVEAICKDVDGKVIGYHWEVDGQPISSTSYRISFTKTAKPQTSHVTITAMDDAREISIPVSIDVNY